LVGILECDLVTSLKRRLTQIGAGGTSEGVSKVALSAIGLDSASLKLSDSDLAVFESITYELD
jgi:hypothetical protein